MPFLTNVPLPQCLQHSSATRFLLALDHDRGCTRYLLEVKCLRPDRQVREHDSNEQCLPSKSLLPMASEFSEYLDHVATARSEYGRYINAFAVRGWVEQLPSDFPMAAPPACQRGLWQAGRKWQATIAPVARPAPTAPRPRRRPCRR